MMDKLALDSQFVLFTMGYLDEQIKDYAVGGMCSKHKWDQKRNA
jgi:hypothetical protein